MDFIPIIYMKDREIHAEEDSNPISYRELLKKISNEKKLYILDIDGIEKDKPNLCTYQRLAGVIDFWVDSGPRDLGDVVDATMSGATSITLRRALCPQILIPDLKEITENRIYECIDITDDSSFNGVDGFINFNEIGEILRDFKFSEFLKQLTSNNILYAYEDQVTNINYWKRFNLEGILVNLNNLKEFKNAFRA